MVFWGFFDYFSSFEKKSKDGRLTEISLFWSYLCDFNASFGCVVEVEKFIKK